MWIDAGRTCDMDDNNRQIDWANGVVTVKVSHTVPAITFSEGVFALIDICGKNQNKIL